MPEVSVIIPAYNHGRYLSQAIQSVQEQTYRDFEIIVVDDGSTDNTRDVVVSFGHSVTYIRQENSGPSSARNSGIRAARGQYVAFLDADDRWEAAFLERMVAALHAHPAAGAVYCGFRYLDELDNPLKVSVCRVVPPDRFRSELVRQCWLSTCSVVARAQCYRECGYFDESLRACEDYDMWLRLSERYEFVGVPEVLVWYRRIGNNTTDDVERMFVALMTVARKHWPGGSMDTAELAPERRCVEKVAYLGAVVGWVARGDFGRATEHFGRALAQYPELGCDFDLWYQVGCAHQPFGERGHFPLLNLGRAEQDVAALLAAIGSQSSARGEMRSMRGAASFALGLLAYGCGDLHRTQRHLWDALWGFPSLLFAPRWWAILGKSFLGSRLLDSLRLLRRRIVPHQNRGDCLFGQE